MRLSRQLRPLVRDAEPAMSGKKVNITQCGMYWYVILIGITQLIWLAAITGIHVVVLVWAVVGLAWGIPGAINLYRETQLVKETEVDNE